MNLFENIQVPSAELEYVIKLSPAERVQYLFELYDIEKAREQNSDLNLNRFFDELPKTEFNDIPEIEEFEVGGSSRVDVMIDDKNILVESNSLKALRIIKSRFIENGFILSRDKETEKMFKKDKLTRYLRVFKIVNQIDPICYN